MLFEQILPNGFEYVVYPTHSPVVAVYLWVDVGSIDESSAEAGYCHFLEHMLFKGTKKRTTQEIAGTIEGSGGDLNAFTSFEYTVYHITIAKDRWLLASEILRDMAESSLFLKAEFDPEKEVILEEIRRCEDSPERQLYRGAYQQLYGNAGYGRPVIGFPRTVKACSALRLKQFWKHWYVPQLMTLVVCGDVDTAVASQKISKTWGKLKSRIAPRKRRRDLGFSHLLASKNKKLESRSFPVQAIRWVGSASACNIRDPHLPALDVASMILGQSESSRLYQRLFREENLVTSIGSGVWAPQGVGMFNIDVESPIEKAGSFRKKLWEELFRFCKEGPTSEELERAKIIIESERIYSAQTMDGLANRLGHFKTVLDNVHFDLEYMAQARELTSETVRNLAKEYFQERPFFEYALLPNDFPKEQLWNGAASIFTKPQKKKNKEKEFEHVVLSNQLELLLCPRNDSPVVSVQASVLGGLLTETRSQAGIGNLLASVWEKGPKGWTAKKFAEYLDLHATQIESYSGRNSFSLASTMLTRQVENILPLFCETFFNPALLEEEFHRSKTVCLEEIKTFEDHLDRVAIKLFIENLFDQSSYAFPLIGYADSVEQFDLSQISTHYKKCIYSRPAVVAVSGRFDPQYVVAEFEKIKRPLCGAKAPADFSGKSLVASRLVEVKKNREQSHLIVGYLGTAVAAKERFDLRVLVTLLGGQSGRLFRELRDKKGLCYTVAPTYFEGYKKPGFFAVYMACDPSKRDAAQAGIFEELGRIAEKPATHSELVRAKEFLLGKQAMDLQLNSSIASAVSFNGLFGLDPKEHWCLKENLNQVTASSIQKLAKKIFNSPSVVAVVV